MIKKNLSIALFLIMMPALVFAAAFSISPVKIYLSAKSPVAVMKVTNSSEQAIQLQTSLNQWTQTNGKDTLTKSQNLLVVPPIFTVAPSATQILRIGLRVKPNSSDETAYRLFITQLPPSIAEKKSEASSVKILLRMSVPIFVAALNPDEQAKLTWQINHKKNHYTLTATNIGNKHAFISHLTIFDQKQQLASKGTFAYILPKSEHQWQLNLDNSPTLIVAKQGDNAVKYALHAQK